MRILPLLFINLFFVNLTFASTCPVIKNQQIYTINQKFFTIGSDFEITASNRKVGTVVQRVLKLAKTFELKNEKNEIVAKATQRIFSLGVKIDVVDCNNQPIGSMQEDILKSLFKIHTVYSILDNKEKLVGQSKKLEWWGTDISFYDASNNLLAAIKRPAINFFTDSWALSQNGSEKIDPRILFFAAAYKTSADDERKSEENNSSNKK